MKLIVPTVAIANKFEYSANLLIQNKTNLDPITTKASLAITSCILEELVFNNLHWVKVKNDLNQVLSEQIDWWRSDVLSGSYPHSEFCVEFYCSEIEPVRSTLLNILENLPGHYEDEDARWRIWYLLDIRGDSLLERGMDYRIAEFERRVLNGEWRV